MHVVRIECVLYTCTVVAPDINPIHPINRMASLARGERWNITESDFGHGSTVYISELYLSLAIANRQLYILEPYPWFHPCQNKILRLIETRVHAALAMSATLAAVGAIFKLSTPYVLARPVFRAQRCKPCPVVLVSTLGCSRCLPPSPLLLASALSGNIIPRYKTAACKCAVN